MKRTASSPGEIAAVEHKREKTVSTEHEALEGEDGLKGGGSVRCGLEFFNKPCVELARAMLGCVLVCCGEDGEECRGEVVEVEAYLGGQDKAAHSYNGRRTRANEAMYMAPGTAYVYSIYGVHCCLNVSSCGSGAAVLIRALQATAGLDSMRRRRGRGRRKEGGHMRDIELCNGPGKLCQALSITKQYDQVDMVTSSSLWLERGNPSSPDLIMTSPRVGIDSAGEWVAAQLRFYHADCPYVSKTRRSQATPSGCG